ncbi:hypothetical protein A0H81_10338 [Grifola frondosa]|uniref:Uncharacterized protein n=1 Tax=Grifola frondosa TaxID=5627 RepID=A0A1C7M0G4_GRIFR|nr:hypothetical protein A0H81_10340 [Grifola frondosa]OBZ69873.1 hypothetical protein A0H81_10338 [Grifola frondosa]
MDSAMCVASDTKSVFVASVDNIVPYGALIKNGSSMPWIPRRMYCEGLQRLGRVSDVLYQLQTTSTSPATYFTCYLRTLQTIMTDCQDVSNALNELAKSHGDEPEFLSAVFEAAGALTFRSSALGTLVVTARLNGLFFNVDSIRGYSALTSDAAGTFVGQPIPPSATGGTFRMFVTHTTVRLELYTIGSPTPWHIYEGRGRQHGLPARVDGEWS